MYREILISEIHGEDRRFAISYPEPPGEPLARSLREQGLIHPLGVWSPTGQPPWILVTGRRRWRVLRDLGRASCPAWVASPETLPRELFLRSLQDNLSSRPLNPREAALALSGLLDLGEPEAALRETWIPLLSPGYAPRDLATFRRFGELAPRHQEALARDELHPQFLERLLRQAPVDRDAVLDVVLALQLGRNDQKQFLERLEVISFRETIVPGALLQEPALREILAAPGVSGGQKYAQLAAALDPRFRPELHRLLAALEERLRSAGPGFAVKAPGNLEGGRLTLSATFGSPEELRELAGKIAEWAGQGPAGEIFDLLTGRRKP